MTTTFPEAPETTTFPAAAVEAAPAPGVDPAAPYGRTPAGRARSRPLSGKRGRPKGRTQRTSTIGAKGQGAGSGKSKAIDYRPGVIRLTQMLMIPVAFRAPLDAAVVTRHVAGDDTQEFPGLARAVSNCAQEYPQIAAALDKVLAAGPVAELVAAAVPLAVQLLHNHGKIPPAMAEAMGAQDPEEIRAALAAEGERLARAA